MAVPIVRITGPLTESVAGLRSDLLRQGYTELSCRNLLRLASHLSRWLEAKGLGLRELSDEHVDAFLRLRRTEGYTGFLSRRGLGPILRHLTEAGLVPVPATAVDPTPADKLLAAYQGFLIRDRGLTAPVARSYSAVARQLLVETSNSCEFDVSSLDGTTVKQFVLKTSRVASLNQTRNTLTGLRSFLRFLHVRGDITMDLTGAVPKIAGWRLASLPKYLAPEQVSAIVDSCDRRSTIGRRDYAILLLLARMALRAKEVASLSLDDVDWKEGVVLIPGKGGRKDCMPLSNEVGAALASYLGQRRRTPWRSLFQRSRAPYTPLNRSGITSVMYRACARADVPLAGAHRLRHSAGTTMLRRGATLDEVAQALRHKSHATTAIYAKVDHCRLRELAQPWPGGAA